MLELIDIINKRTKKELNKRKREAKKKKEKQTSENLMRFFFHDATLTQEEERETFEFFIREIENAIRPSIRTILTRQDVQDAEALATVLGQNQDNVMSNYRVLVSTILRGTETPSNNNNEEPPRRRS